MTSWLRKSAIEMYSTRNEEKSVVAEKFIGTLNDKLYKFVTLIQKMSILKKQMTQRTNTTIHMIAQSK